MFRRASDTLVNMVIIRVNNAFTNMPPTPVTGVTRCHCPSLNPCYAYCRIFVQVTLLHSLKREEQPTKPRYRQLQTPGTTL